MTLTIASFSSKDPHKGFIFCKAQPGNINLVHLQDLWIYGRVTISQPMSFLLHPCYSKRGLWTSSMGITWELVRDAESLDLPNQNLHVNKIPGGWCAYWRVRCPALLHAAALLPQSLPRPWLRCESLRSVATVVLGWIWIGKISGLPVFLSASRWLMAGTGDTCRRQFRVMEKK